MPVSIDSAAYNVLESYHSKSTSDKLCVKKGVDGKEYLDTIDKEVADSGWNQFKKIFGLGPLAKTDTSIKGVEEYLVKLFNSDIENNALKNMTVDSNAYKTTAKIAKLASEKGINELKNQILEENIEIPDEQKNQISLEDARFIIAKGGNFKDIQNLKELTSLLKTYKKTDREIKEQEAGLAYLEALKSKSSEDKLSINQLKLSISDLSNLRKQTENIIMVNLKGSSAAKKLSFEDLHKLYVNNLFDLVYDEKRTEADLREFIDDLQEREPTDEKIRKNISLQDLELLILSKEIEYRDSLIEEMEQKKQKPDLSREKLEKYNKQIEILKAQKEEDLEKLTKLKMNVKTEGIVADEVKPQEKIVLKTGPGAGVFLEDDDDMAILEKPVSGEEKEPETFPQEPLSIEEIMKDGQKYVNGLSQEELKKEYDRVSYLEATVWDLDEKYDEYLKLLEAKVKEIGEIK